MFIWRGAKSIATGRWEARRKTVRPWGSGMFSSVRSEAAYEGVEETPRLTGKIKRSENSCVFCESDAVITPTRICVVKPLS
jgi:hypothetical protein